MAANNRTDRWFAVFLTAFAIAVVVESWRMPRLGELGVHPMSAPGLTPGLLGLVLLCLGLALLARSVRSPSASIAVDPASASTWWRAALTIALCLTYSVGLLGHLPFMLATGLFVFGFVAIFSFDRARLLGTFAGALAMAVAVALSVSLLFEQVFLVRLP